MSTSFVPKVMVPGTHRPSVSSFNCLRHLGDRCFVTRAGDDRSSVGRFWRFARRLYGGRNPHSRMFLYALLISDSASLLFIIATSFLPRSELSRALDLAFGLAFLPELMSRLAGVRNS
jgi:hypothetical protein